MVNTASALADCRVVRPAREGDCMVWLGRVAVRGDHPIAHAGGGSYIAAARAIWQHAYGEIPDTLRLFRLCGNRRCVAPAHRAPRPRPTRRLTRAPVRAYKAIAAELASRAAPGGPGGFWWLSGRLVARPAAVRDVARTLVVRPVDVLAVYGRLVEENR